MKLLNLGCGSVRPPAPWFNVDDLYSQLMVGTPERTNLDAEPNYMNWDLRRGLKFETDCVYDGVLASHVIEHMDCMEGVALMRECLRVLRPGGLLVVSVPDASYFRKNYEVDTVENAERVFGEPIYLPDGETTFFGYALWMREHCAILTEDALWAYFARAGFDKIHRISNQGIAIQRELVEMKAARYSGDAWGFISQTLNRLNFSLIMAAKKPSS